MVWLNLKLHFNIYTFAFLDVKKRNILNIIIKPEVFFVRPKKSAPHYINLRKIYKIKSANIKQDKLGVIRIYIEELKTWVMIDHFYLDPLFYN